MGPEFKGQLWSSARHSQGAESSWPGVQLSQGFGTPATAVPTLLPRTGQPSGLAPSSLPCSPWHRCYPSTVQDGGTPAQALAPAPPQND